MKTIVGLEYFQLQQWHKKLYCFCHTCNKQAPGYKIELIPTCIEAYQARHIANVPSLSFKRTIKKLHFSHQLS